MLLSDLMRSRVVDADGVEIGRIVDTLLVQDGPRVGAFGPQLRVEGLVIGRRSLGIRLGYHRAGVRGPAPLRMLFERLDRNALYARWDHVATVDEGVDDGIVRLRCAMADLGEPPRI